MDCGLLRVTRAGASEPGWPLCVTSGSGHSKFHVLREPGLSYSESGHGVTALAGLALVSMAVREERGKYIPPPKFKSVFCMASECDSPSDSGRGE